MIILKAKKILPNSWIDYGIYMKTLGLADKVLGKGNFDFIRQFGYYDARDDAKGIYKALLSFLSPQTVVKSCRKLFTQYYDKGKLTIVSITTHRVIFKIEDAPDIPRYHDVELEAYFEELRRLSGAKNIKWTNHRALQKVTPSV